MKCNIFKSILFLILIAICSASNTMQAFICHIDVLAKVIPMPDGSEKVDVQIVGSDLHNVGTPTSDWALLIKFTDFFNPGSNVVDLLVENINPGKDQKLRRAIETQMVLNNLYSSICTSPMPNFTLSHGTYERVKKFINPNLNFGNFFGKIDHIMNVDIRNWVTGIRFLEMQEGKDLAIQALSSQSLNNILNEIDLYCNQIEEPALKKLFLQLKENILTIVDSLRKIIISNQPDSDYDIALKDLFSLSDTEIAVIISMNKQFMLNFSKKTQCIARIIDISGDFPIQFKALWHAYNAQARKSNRVVSLMGGTHTHIDASKKILGSVCTAPSELLGTMDDSPDMINGLKAMGYVQLESFNFFQEQKATKNLDAAQAMLNSMEDYINWIQLYCDQYEIFADKVADYICFWSTISNEEVRNRITMRNVLAAHYYEID